ncbi:mannosyl-3-phosphoglycerate synthase, partial [Diaporthe sp. PMI_573]
MRFSASKSTARIGQVEIRGVQHVVEFEARDRQPSNRRGHHGQQPTEAVSPEAIDAIQSRTAIVVPCKDEPVNRIVSVWAGIPAGSLIIVVSASAQDMYDRERDALARFCRDTGRDGISVHQRDEKLAKALSEVGMTGLLGDDGLVHGGKGEALQSHGCAAGDGGRTSYYKYIGFIDADNYVTGSVSEYCKAFSAGFHLASAPDAMVRINWGSKPKVHDGEIVFKTSGRSSEVVNRHFNQLLGQLHKTGSCTFSGEACEHVENDKGDMELHHICTGNAGEHAMTMSLALKLRLAGGYAIEPFHFIDIFDRFAGDHMVKSAPASLMREPHSIMSTVSSSLVSTPVGTSPCSSQVSETRAATSFIPTSSQPAPSAVDQGLLGYSPEEPHVTPKIQILQIRTMNPHFHDTNKGEAHIIRMWMQGLSAMYHSRLT